MNCGKLSLDACMHAAQNERLPLRTVIQVKYSTIFHYKSMVPISNKSNKYVCHVLNLQILMLLSVIKSNATRETTSHVVSIKEDHGIYNG